MRDLYQRLGLSSTLEKEKNKFIERIYTSLNEMYTGIGTGIRESVYYEVSFLLGEVKYHEYTAFLYNEKKEKKRFEEILLVCELFLEALAKLAESSAGVGKWFRFFHDRVEGAFSNSIIDLGYIFNKGSIMKQGVQEFDNKLLIDPLSWLSKYPTAKNLFDGALKEYFTKDYPDVVTKCYSAFESLCKTILNTDMSLDNMIPGLLKLLKLPQDWNSILKNYCHYAHEFASRHGKRDGKAVKANEKDVEAYLYLTGLLIRLLVRSKN